MKFKMMLHMYNKSSRCKFNTTLYKTLWFSVKFTSAIFVHWMRFFILCCPLEEMQANTALFALKTFTADLGHITTHNHIHPPQQKHTEYERSRDNHKGNIQYTLIFGRTCHFNDCFRTFRGNYPLMLADSLPAFQLSLWVLSIAGVRSVCN